MEKVLDIGILSALLSKSDLLVEFQNIIDVLTLEIPSHLSNHAIAHREWLKIAIITISLHLKFLLGEMPMVIQMFPHSHLQFCG
ncbi:hypothetical protein OIU77_022654 [Salix suchowensis]|uniref:Uncharacterized protein n=1 Tax=Salix suchowensis TaxID=1278906 RepID=A0ABQ9C5F9_9ROSI|nr:hypothetical protein OIU77_022654 [Salix suchowensis]